MAGGLIPLNQAMVGALALGKTEIHVPTLSLTSCVISGKLISLCYFPLHEMGLRIAALSTSLGFVQI